MRAGMNPLDACMHALRRLVETTAEKRLLDKEGKPKFDVKFYALAKDGQFGGASLWSGAQFAVFADGKNRLEPCPSLFTRSEKK